MALDYEALLRQYPWIVERDQNCILSPDSDGLLCGLLMSHYLNWKIRGFYNGKVFAIEQGISPANCIFLDMEIFRSNIRSVGQHMVMYDKADLRGGVTNIDSRTHSLKSATRTQAEAFLRMLANKTGWNFTSTHWSWGPYQTFRFRKGSVKPGKARYNALFAQNPISLAIISRNSIEYTIDGDGVL